MVTDITIDKLVHGGQGMGQLPDGRKVFVWDAYPGEQVQIRITKNRRDYAEAILEKIIKASPERIEPKDEAFLSTSPWQTLSWPAENRYKKDILTETFSRSHIICPQIEYAAAGKAGPVRFSEPEFISGGPMENPPGVFHYRNKMEYSFWADETGLHLALYHRGSHGKRIVPGSSIARPEIDQTANKICAILNKHGIRGSQLKTMIVRANQNGETVAGLFVKDRAWPEISELATVCRGVVIYFSNPKSPASVATKQLQLYGDISLSDTVHGTPISYDVNSFFQVNLPIFNLALQQIKQAVAGQRKIIDMYSGVGTIGVAVGAHALIESDHHNATIAKQNALKGMTVIQASTEDALDYITPDAAIIFDPPRAGLHSKVIDRLMEAKPPLIAYLSCNPSTQARDLSYLRSSYRIQSLTGYNFFPRTPHIESLAILEAR